MKKICLLGLGILGVLLLAGRFSSPEGESVDAERGAGLEEAKLSRSADLPPRSATGPRTPAHDPVLEAKINTRDHVKEDLIEVTSDVAEVRDGLEALLVYDLKLTPKEVKKFYRLRASLDQEIVNYFKANQPDPFRMDQDLKAIQKKYDLAVRKVLGDENYARYKAFAASTQEQLSDRSQGSVKMLGL